MHETDSQNRKKHRQLYISIVAQHHAVYPQHPGTRDAPACAVGCAVLSRRDTAVSVARARHNTQQYLYKSTNHTLDTTLYTQYWLGTDIAMGLMPPLVSRQSHSNVASKRTEQVHASLISDSVFDSALATAPLHRRRFILLLEHDAHTHGRQGH